MLIGNFETGGNVYLAPMAGVTDLPFRVMCRRYGADMSYTEMINSKALCFHDINTKKMLEVHREEGLVAVQIFGNDPEYMAEATRIISGLNRFSVIDINMGCPAPKIVKNNEGSALMKDIKLASKIIKAVKINAKVPITVKFRKGWDENSINAVDFGLMAEASGADAVTVHGRTREQYYSGNADWDIIRKVKSKLSIPVIGNGDIFSVEKAKEIFEQTGVDGFMIGRGAQGNPFIFREIKSFEESGKIPKMPSESEKISACLNHYELAIKFKGEDKGVKEMRKHIGWYLKGLQGCAKLKDQINHMKTSNEVRLLLKEYFLQLSQ
ncbi:MAG: tRNA dihydrouridine synthase DusB [Filifactoraceae bacterium]